MIMKDLIEPLCTGDETDKHMGNKAVWHGVQIEVHRVTMFKI